MDNITLISCSYNTPEVTLTMLKSFFKHHNSTNVLLIDNSTNDDTKKLLEINNIPFISSPGGVHIKSVDKLFAKINTKYALLVDTDVIFLKNNESIFKQFCEHDLTLLGDVCGDRGGKKIHYRVHPWYCFINVDTIKANNITFFNSKKQFEHSDKIYDVGCTFYSDIKETGLKIGDIKVENVFYKHYEGMSWRTKRFGSEDGDIDFSETDTHNNINMYNYGKHIEECYAAEIETYKDITLKIK